MSNSYRTAREFYIALRKIQFVEYALKYCVVLKLYTSQNGLFLEIRLFFFFYFFLDHRS